VKDILSNQIKLR